MDAVKSENESWNTFEACEEVPYNGIVKGASVIPLGELFTIKRTRKYKFRQIALGNMLKEGKDYDETFASTVSGDGSRSLCSVAATCGMQVKGWDATTGYLQTKQRVPVYAYLRETSPVELHVQPRLGPDAGRRGRIAGQARAWSRRWRTLRTAGWVESSQAQEQKDLTDIQSS